MNPPRLALLLALSFVACDSGSSEAAKPTPAKAETEVGTKAAEAKGSGPAKAVAPPAYTLPDGAESKGTALAQRFSNDDADFDIESASDHRTGLLWVAAKGDKPDQVAAALRRLDELDSEAYDPLPVKVALGRLDSKNPDVFGAAVQLVGAAMWFEPADPLAVQSLRAIVEGDSTTERKAEVARMIDGRDDAAFLALAKSALGAEEPEVVAYALSKLRRRKTPDVRAELETLAKARLDDENPQLAAEALDAYARVANKDDTAARAAIESRLKSKHPIVRAYAVVAFARVAGKAAAPAIAEAMNDTAKTSERLKVRYAEGGGFGVGAHQPVREVRHIVPTALSAADPGFKRNRVDWNKPESVEAFETQVKGWAKKAG
ncbi:MAG: hypothetical protein ACRBN8_12300 [Nannocystales bacterium]